MGSFDVDGSVALCYGLRCVESCIGVRACTKVRFSEMADLRRPTLFGNTWVHDENQVVLLVGCRMPGNEVEVDKSAGLAC